MDQALNSRAVSFEKILNSLLLKKVEIEGQNPVTWARKHHIPIEKVVESQLYGANSAELLGAFIDAGEFYVSIADRKRGQKRNDPEAWAQSVKYNMDSLEFNLLDPYNANLEEHLIGLAKANTKIGVNKEHPFVWAAKQDINWLSTNWHNADSHMPLEAMLNKMKEGKASILPTLVALEEAGIKVNGEHPLVWAANQGMKRESLRKGLAELEKKGIDTIGIVKGLKVETLDPKRIKTKSLEPETASESGELSSRRVAQDSAKIPESLKPETPVRKLVMLSSRRVTPVSPKIPLHAHKKSHVERLAEESRATNSSSKERK